MTNIAGQWSQGSVDEWPWMKHQSVSVTVWMHDIVLVSGVPVVRSFAEGKKIEIICIGTSERCGRMLQTFDMGDVLDLWGATAETPVENTAILSVHLGNDLVPGSGWVTGSRTSPSPESLSGTELCAGSAGFLRAVRHFGGRGDAAIELDKDVFNFGRRVFAHEAVRWINDSIADPLALTGLEAVHLVGAGVPCQPFSAAGAKKGTDSFDGRLAGHALRATQALRAHALIIEEVCGFAQWAGGRAVKELRAALQAIWGPKASLQILKYDLRLWLPQSRRRVVIILTREALPKIVEYNGPHVCDAAAMRPRGAKAASYGIRLVHLAAREASAQHLGALFLEVEAGGADGARQDTVL